MDALGNRPLERYALSLLRIIAGFLFTFHGAQKLFGLFGGMGGHGAQAPVLSLPWFAAILEFFGGLLMVLGLFTRPVAFILSGEMAFAYFRVHAPRAFWPIANMGELAVLYCFIFLYFSAAGAGPISVDWMIGRRRRKNSNLI
jgi:putative oxidoreductase